MPKKAKKEKGIGPGLSKRIIEFLQEQDKDLKEIARLAGTTQKYLSEVLAGKKGFSEKHLENLQQETNILLHLAPVLAGELARRGGKKGSDLLMYGINPLAKMACSMMARILGD